MKLLDVNILLALTLSKHSHHQAAVAWLEGEEQPASLCICRSTQQGLLRLLTTAEVLKLYGNSPLTNQEAWDVIEQFMADDRMTYLDEPTDIEETWKTLALRDTASPKLWMDAWLAAFALCAGLQMVTTDKAFSQFKGLKLELIIA